MAMAAAPTQQQDFSVEQHEPGPPGLPADSEQHTHTQLQGTGADAAQTTLAPTIQQAMAAALNTRPARVRPRPRMGLPIEPIVPSAMELITAASPRTSQQQHQDATSDALASLPPHLAHALAPPPPMPGVDPICGPLYAKPIPPNVLGVTVHKADAFRPDGMLTNPVVRLHILDPASGQYVRNLMVPDIPLPPPVQAQMLRYPGRPATMTRDNNTPGARPALQEHLPPVQTAPYNLLRRMDPSASAVWGETILVDEALERLVALDALLVFEILQLPASFHRYLKHPDQFPAGTHRVAWAFLRFNQPLLPAPTSHSVFPQGDGLPAADHAPPHPLHPRGPTLGDLKLQLYRYRREPLLGGVRTPFDEEEEDAPGGPPLRAYLSWKQLMATLVNAPKDVMSLVEKYPAALHVTVQALPRPEPEVVKVEPSIGVRAMLPAGYGSGFEEGSVPLLPFMVQHFGVSPAGGYGLMGGLGGLGGLSMTGHEQLEKCPFYRSMGESCRLPNRRWKLLATGPGGACCAAFSGDGSRVASAVAEGPRGDAFHIVIYNVLTGGEWMRLPHAHRGWVYALSWAKDDTALLTAASDGTAQVWEMALYHGATRTIKPRVLRHPGPVYAAVFHPTPSTHPIVVTGGRAGSLHVWHRFSGQQLHVLTHGQGLSHAPAMEPGPRPLGDLCGPIHALVFDSLGARLWAGDKQGVIQEFSMDLGAVSGAVSALTTQTVMCAAPASGQATRANSPGHTAYFQPAAPFAANLPFVAGTHKNLFGPQAAPTTMTVQPGVLPPSVQPHPKPWPPPPNGGQMAHQPALGSLDPFQVTQRPGAMLEYFHRSEPVAATTSSVDRAAVVAEHASGMRSSLKAAAPTWPQLWVPELAPAPQQHMETSGSSVHPGAAPSAASGPRPVPGAGVVFNSVTEPMPPPQPAAPAPPAFLHGSGAVHLSSTPLPGSAGASGAQPSLAPGSNPWLEQSTPAWAAPAAPQWARGPQPLGEAVEYEAAPGAAVVGPPAPPPQAYGAPAGQALAGALGIDAAVNPNLDGQPGEAPTGGVSWAQQGPTLLTGSSHTTLGPAMAPERPFLRAVRSCKALAGEPIAGLTLAPNGRKLVIQTQNSRVATLDTRAFRDPRDMGRARCRTTLLRPACSPDGTYLLTGGEDGAVRAWDGVCTSLVDTPASVLLPHCMLGTLVGGPPLTTGTTLAAQTNRPAHSVAWNSYLHMVAVCGWGSWSPLLLAVHDPACPPWALGCEETPHAPRRHQPVSRSLRSSLPDTLTPSMVRALLADVRADARKRGLLPAPPLSDGGLLAPQSMSQRLRVAGPPNVRGALGEPFPHPAVDQLVIKQPPPTPLTRTAPPALAPQAPPATPQPPPSPAAPTTTAASPPGPAARPATERQTAVQAAAPPAPTLVTPAKPTEPGPSQAAPVLDRYAPGELSAKDGPEAARIAALVNPDPTLRDVGPPATVFTNVNVYKPNLGSTESDEQPSGRAATASAPAPLHTLPALQAVPFASALPPQQNVPHPVMVGPGATVVVGPGATVITHPGATVRPAADPMEHYTPQVSQKEYVPQLSKPLPDMGVKSAGAAQAAPPAPAPHLPQPSSRAASPPMPKAATVVGSESTQAEATVSRSPLASAPAAAPAAPVATATASHHTTVAPSSGADPKHTPEKATRPAGTASPAPHTSAQAVPTPPTPTPAAPQAGKVEPVQKAQTPVVTPGAGTAGVPTQAPVEKQPSEAKPGPAAEPAPGASKPRAQADAASTAAPASPKRDAPADKPAAPPAPASAAREDKPASASTAAAPLSARRPQETPQAGSPASAAPAGPVGKSTDSPRTEASPAAPGSPVKTATTKATPQAGSPASAAPAGPVGKSTDSPRTEASPAAPGSPVKTATTKETRPSGSPAPVLGATSAARPDEPQSPSQSTAARPVAQVVQAPPPPAPSSPAGLVVAAPLAAVKRTSGPPISPKPASKAAKPAPADPSASSTPSGSVVLPRGEASAALGSSPRAQDGQAASSGSKDATTPSTQSQAPPGASTTSSQSAVAATPAASSEAATSRTGGATAQTTPAPQTASAGPAASAPGNSPSPVPP